MSWHTVVDPSAPAAGGGHKHLRVAVCRFAEGRTQVAWPGGQMTLEAEAAESARDAGAASMPRPSGTGRAATGPLRAPMAARVLTVETHVGADVPQGTRLIVLEAMKMEHALLAPADSCVSAVHVAAGDQVAQGQSLITLAPQGPTP